MSVFTYKYGHDLNELNVIDLKSVCHKIEKVTQTVTQCN